MNLKIRTSSLPSFTNPSQTNETFPMISPPISIRHDNSLPFPIEQNNQSQLNINQLPLATKVSNTKLFKQIFIFSLS